MAEFKAALRLVWLVVTLAATGAAAAPFVLPEGAIARLAPLCESRQRFGRECFLCGTTTGFIAIAHGDWNTAAHSNRLAIPLFAIFSMNAAAAGVYLFRHHSQ